MITIIGAGALGLCTAYFLHKEGHEVQVLEKDGPQLNSGCSYGNAGLIVPSHFIPLAAPGIINQGMKWLLDKKSPFYIKPRVNADLFNWLWLFYRSANQKNVERIGDQLFVLNQASHDLYAEIIKNEGFEACFESKGLLMLYQTEKMESEEIRLSEEAKKMGIDVKVLNAAEVQALEPDLDLNIRGGVHYLTDSHLDPGLFMDQIKKHLTEVGVKIHHNVSCKSIRTNGKKITHIQTDQGDYTSEKVVIASGAWSQRLSKELGVKIPLQGGKGYSLTMQNSKQRPNIPSVLCERKIAVTPMGQNLRIAGTMEVVGTNRDVSPHRVDALKEGVKHFIRNFDAPNEGQVKPWAGLRPVSPDGMPYIGKCDNWDNLFVNTGHAMMGMSLAPVSGQILSHIIEGKPVDFNTQLLSPNRF